MKTFYRVFGFFFLLTLVVGCNLNSTVDQGSSSSPPSTNSIGVTPSTENTATPEATTSGSPTPEVTPYSGTFEVTSSLLVKNTSKSIINKKSLSKDTTTLTYPYITWEVWGHYTEAEADAIIKQNAEIGPSIWPYVALSTPTEVATSLDGTYTSSQTLDAKSYFWYLDSLEHWGGYPLGGWQCSTDESVGIMTATWSYYVRGTLHLEDGTTYKSTCAKADQVMYTYDVNTSTYTGSDLLSAIQSSDTTLTISFSVNPLLVSGVTTEIATPSPTVEATSSPAE